MIRHHIEQTERALIALHINAAGECRRAAMESARTGERVGFNWSDGHKKSARNYLADVRARRALVVTPYVLNGHTLGLVRAVAPHQFEVLHGSVLKGGHDWRNGPVPIGPRDELRIATKADFHAFNVSPKGHLRQWL